MRAQMMQKVASLAARLMQIAATNIEILMKTMASLARAVGFEPTTNRLTADCSTAELRPIKPSGCGGREGVV
jgi:hypothetical protein